MTLNLVGATFTCVLGLLGLLQPTVAARFTSIKPDGKTGLSEIRATYGGFFLTLGAYCLIVQADLAFSMLGLAWVGAAGGRVISIVVDQSREPRNLGGVLFEGLIGALLLL